MAQQPKRLSGPERLAIVKRYLVKRVPISDLCDEHGLQPGQIYRWQVVIAPTEADRGSRSLVVGVPGNQRPPACQRRVYSPL